MRLRAALSTPSTKRQYVRRLFTTIADRYDLITVLLSFGCDRRWKRRAAELTRASAGARALDLACGTGDIAFELASRGARVTGLDITPRMIELAASKLQRGAEAPRDVLPRFIVGDMMALPFGAASFDAVTTGYGIRNAPSIGPALGEIHRVLRPGGVVVSLDFNRPSSLPVRFLYLAYLTVVGSVIGWFLHRDPDTYRYIPESIRRYPGAQGVAALMRTHGFVDCRVIPVLGGLMAINTGRRDW